MREQIGDAGLFFTPASVEEVADALRALWDSQELRDDFIEKGRMRSRHLLRNHFRSL